MPAIVIHGSKLIIIGKPLSPAIQSVLRDQIREGEQAIEVPDELVFAAVGKSKSKPEIVGT